MDSPTLNYYQKNAKSIYDLYETAADDLSEYLQASFAKGSSIVDVGAGTACDLRELLSLGYDAIGIEPSEALRTLSISKHPELKGKLLPGSLPELNLSKQFDGIVCSAVLMHIPENYLFDSLLALRDGLKVNGHLLVSIPKDRPGLDEQFRDVGGRLFLPLEADRLILLAERLGLSLISRWENADSLSRPGYNWVTLLFEKVKEL
ncbi:MAG: methyltransferase domain-containing protein [Methylococcales bacterium]